MLGQRRRPWPNIKTTSPSWNKKNLPVSLCVVSFCGLTEVISQFASMLLHHGNRFGNIYVHPTNTRRSANLALMLGHRRRRWVNIETTLD